jgi:hypothetical protein
MMVHQHIGDNIVMAIPKQGDATGQAADTIVVVASGTSPNIPTGRQLLDPNNCNQFPDGVYSTNMESDTLSGLRVLVTDGYGNRGLYDAEDYSRVGRDNARYVAYRPVPHRKATITIAGWTKTVGGK